MLHDRKKLLPQAAGHMTSLYAQHFRLTEAPFSIAPNPRFLFMSEQHREALAHLLYGIGHDGGFVLLTGEVGTGKTTLCRCLLEKVPEDTDVAFIINPRLSVVDLLANICDELGISYDTGKLNNRLLVDAINHYLLDRHAAGRHTVLVIDEAQNLETEVLEQLRLLTNLETHERKLLQIILLGQPELQDKLNTPELRQLSQRVTARYHLQALNHADMQAYIKHRLSIAGCEQSIFAPSALRFVYRRSKGIPRLINLICDRAMLGAFADGVSRINRAMVQQAAREVLGEQSNKQPNAVRFRIALPVAAVLLLALTSWASGLWMAPQAAAPDSVPASVSTSGEAEAVRKARMIEAAPETPASAPAAMADFASEAPAEPDAEAEGTAAIVAALGESLAPVVNIHTLPDEPSPVQNEPPAVVWDSFLHDQQAAFSNLFAAWDLSLPDNSEPCAFAATQGLACQIISGDLGMLRSLNRPAIIDWQRDDGRMAYITVVSLSGSTARVVAGAESFEIPLQQLRQHWLDHFAILWRTPTAYHSDILPGTAGPSAKWLNQRLAWLDGSSSTEADVSGIYDGPWVPRLRRFQRDAGLFPDGVAGPQTLIRLNSALHEPGPRLIQQAEAEVPANDAGQTAAVH